jgi:hypothetical protein
MKRQRKAARRIDARSTDNDCDCCVCRERQQLHDCALWAPHEIPRMVAATILDHTHAIMAGRYGGVAIEDCFD